MQKDSKRRKMALSQALSANVAHLHSAEVCSNILLYIIIPYHFSMNVISFVHLQELFYFAQGHFGSRVDPLGMRQKHTRYWTPVHYGVPCIHLAANSFTTRNNAQRNARFWEIWRNSDRENMQKPTRAVTWIHELWDRNNIHHLKVTLNVFTV